MPDNKDYPCGCTWHYMAHRYVVTCRDHGMVRPEGCTCLNPGKEDGTTTCWQHHDCSDGSCTHRE